MFTCRYGHALQEACLPEVWPHLDIAKTLAQQIEAMQLLRIEEEHLEAL